MIESALTWAHNADTLRDYMTRHGLTATRVAKLVAVNSRTVRRWTATDEDALAMPYAAWVCLRYWVELAKPMRC